MGVTATITLPSRNMVLVLVVKAVVSRVCRGGREASICAEALRTNINSRKFIAGGRLVLILISLRD